MDREAWRAEVHGVIKYQTWLSNRTTTTDFEADKSSIAEEYPTWGVSPQGGHREVSSSPQPPLSPPGVGAQGTLRNLFLGSWSTQFQVGPQLSPIIMATTPSLGLAKGVLLTSCCGQDTEVGFLNPPPWLRKALSTSCHGEQSWLSGDPPCSACGHPQAQVVDQVFSEVSGWEKLLSQESGETSLPSQAAPQPTPRCSLSLQPTRPKDLRQILECVFPFCVRFMHAKLIQSCPTLCGPVDCSPPGSSDQGILQARILEWGTIPSSKGSSWPRNRTHLSSISCNGRGFFATRATWKAQWPFSLPNKDEMIIIKWSSLLFLHLSPHSFL